MEKDKEGLKAGLIENVATSKISSHCCCYYLFCCCCCCADQKVNLLNYRKFYSKSYYITKWRDFLEREQNSKKQFEDPFRILTNLWAHKNVIKDLETIRLNPNIMIQNPIRNDLEFYIPQLCTFLIFGEYEVVEEFLAFLCKACYASFFFAHRIIWFLKSILDSNSTYYHKIINIIHLIQTIFKSEKDKTELVSFHIGNNEKFIESLKKNNMLIIYNESSLISPELEILIEKKTIGKNLIATFSDKSYEFIKNNEIKEKEGDQFKWDQKINYENIFVDIFKRQDISQPENNFLQLETLEQIDEEDYNLTSFLSNINFIDKLSNICELMRIAPPDDQMEILCKEINSINKLLPSNLYIPFLSNTIRNYIIVHIPVSETRIFRTKNRAPYMLTVELIRIDELIFYLNSIKKERNSHFSENIRSYSFQTHRKSNEEFIVTKDRAMTPKRKDKNKDDKKTKDKENIGDTIEYLKEQDVILSKPVMIKNINKSMGNSMSKSNKIVKVVDGKKKKVVSIDNEEEEYKKIDQYVKQRTTISYNRFESKLKSKELNNSENIFSKTGKDIIDKHLKPTETSPEIMLKAKNNLIEEEVKTNADMPLDDYKENPSQIFYEGSTTEKQVDMIFGEKIEEQTARLKRTSPFGNCTSWKLFKVIVKSGEDLRQEQFATQLINEFNQIFHLENVEMWLNPYEILSTGNNCGIIECVPNAVSLDYLKRKGKNFSTLRQFFEQYFGDTNRQNFKKAIDNFVRSLAAYSLVCYFLQIKDRHNGNILIDDKGHIIHIDFGFMLSNAPGKGLQFEKAPFKLTYEFVEVIGGVNSPNFSKFRKLLWKGFIAASKHHEKILMLVEMMYCGHGNNLPCFLKGQDTIDELRQRFIPRKNMNKRDYISHVDKLIESSIDNWRTKWYDKFQYWFQGIFY